MAEFSAPAELFRLCGDRKVGLAVFISILHPAKPSDNCPRHPYRPVVNQMSRPLLLFRAPSCITHRRRLQHMSSASGFSTAGWPFSGGKTIHSLLLLALVTKCNKIDISAVLIAT